jgi:predicted MFS family arabinose efflux permease
MSSSTAASDRKPMVAAGTSNALVLTALAYLPTVFCMMTVGVIVPFIDVLGAELAASRAQLGLSIALFSMPTAILATAGGALIDRYGVRRSMLFAVATSSLGSLLASRAHSLLALDCAMLISGAGFGGTCVSAPSLLIRTLTGPIRTRAMAFWSTFAPTGYAAGLLLAVPFTAHDAWHVALRVHVAILLAVLPALVWLLPRTATGTATSRDSLRHTFSRMLSIIREPRVLRLGIAVALPNAVSYGTSLAIPSYLARVHHLTIATSSAAVAGAKIAAMIIGGLSMGYLLSRAVSAGLLFGTMVAIGVLAQTLLFLPSSGVALATAALILWLFAFGGMAGAAMSLLPNVVGDPARSGVASGVVNQFISLACFAAPSTWLALHSSMQFVLLALVALLASLFALPYKGAVRAPGRS